LVGVIGALSYSKTRRLSLLIGSGVSRAVQIPSGWEVVLELTRRVAALEGVHDQTDWAAGNSTFRRFRER
jgi:hypothetical protein